MSGHSHWASIKHQKGSADAKRGKLFSKLARVIITAAREGGGDPDKNLKLRYAIDKAKEQSMPKDTIERAVLKGTGELGGVQMERITYEGYGPSGAAIMAEVLTDNRNRTASEIRKIFETRGGNLGSSGCVGWMFEAKGLFTVKADAVKDEDEIMTIALDVGAEDVKRDGDTYQITCSATDFFKVKEGLKAKGLQLDMAELTRLPKTTVTLNEADAKKLLALLEAIDDHEDVENTYSNFELSEKLVRELSS